MRKDKILYDIREAIRAYNKDAKVTNAYILHLVNITRDKYIRQEQTRNPGEDVINYTQTLILDMEKVDRSYVPSPKLNLSIARTKKVLPTLLGKEVLKNLDVRSVDRISQEIEFMDKARAIVASSELFIFAFLDDDHRIYLVSKSNAVYTTIKQIAVTCILLEPDAITELHGLTEELTEYPITGNLWALMKPEILQLIVASMNIPIDTVNDNQSLQ